MKKRKIAARYLYSGSLSFVLVLLLAGLSYYNDFSSENINRQTTIPAVNSHIYNSTTFIQPASNHKIEVTLFPEKKYISAHHELLWINTTGFSTAEVQFHLYPNAFSSSNTVYMKGMAQPVEGRSKIKFNKVMVNNQPGEFIYIHPEIPNKNDSTVAKIVLPGTVRPGDSVRFVFDYQVPVPKGTKRFGYATGRNFFFISEWYPKPGVFEKGKWICSQYHPYADFYSDFGSYDVIISVPANYQVGATGGANEPGEKRNGRNIYRVKQDNVHDFAWMASDEIFKHVEPYRRSDGTNISIISFIQPENLKYSKRFISAIRNSLQFFEEHIGIYPYRSITLIDAPRTSLAGGMEYPTLITVGAELFSPTETLQPESVTIYEFSHQYFSGIIANNEVYEAWLDEGLSAYITAKIIDKYYGRGVISFDLFNYYPVYGLNFLSYNEIPLIYSLGKYYYPEGALSLARYLRSPQQYAITDTSYLLPDAFLYGNASYSKPELVLISLERYLGFNKIMKIFKNYYEQYKFKHTTGSNFLKIIQQNTSEDLTWFFELFQSSSIFDYKVKYIRAAESGTYDVYVERLGDGIFKQDVALYTKKDTLMLNWNGKERWKILKFRTTDEVIGAEIDPYRKNILDLNYSNNSFFIKHQYGGSLGLTLRWFFWMQNLLLILGSIA